MVVRTLKTLKTLPMSKLNYDIQNWFAQFTDQKKTKKLLRIETDPS